MDIKSYIDGIMMVSSNIQLFFHVKIINIIEAEKRFGKNSFDQTNLWRLYVSQGRGVFNSDNIGFNLPNQKNTQNIDLGV